MSEAIAPPETRTKEAEQLADRYLALWNEPNPERRRGMIAELWTEDGSQILQPPQEMREIAASAGLGMAATLEARGHAELEGAGGNVLRAVGRVRRTQLQAARRRLSAARSGQVPLGGRLAGRRGDGGGARVSRPRDGRPDSARLRVHRELGGSRAGALRSTTYLGG